MGERAADDQDGAHAALIQWEIGMSYTADPGWYETGEADRWRRLIDRGWELWRAGRADDAEWWEIYGKMVQGSHYNAHYRQIEEEEGPLWLLLNAILEGEDPGLDLPVLKS